MKARLSSTRLAAQWRKTKLPQGYPWWLSFLKRVAVGAKVTPNPPKLASIKEQQVATAEAIKMFEQHLPLAFLNAVQRGGEHQLGACGETGQRGFGRAVQLA